MYLDFLGAPAPSDVGEFLCLGKALIGGVWFYHKVNESITICWLEELMTGYG